MLNPSPQGEDPYSAAQACITAMGSETIVALGDTIIAETQVISDFSLMDQPLVPGTYTGILPALAMPLEGKTAFSWPQDQHAHMQTLKGRVERLLTIGWRAAEPHFLDLLRIMPAARLKAVVVTGGDDAGREAANIEARLRPPFQDRGEWRHHLGGFGTLPDSDLLSWLLEG
jgi:hypothetical protein